MPKAILKLACRQIIDSASQTNFEKAVFHLSYEEYKMKSQAYNVDETFTTFTALKAKDRRANSLHYKSGFAVCGLVENLQNEIPGLWDASGQAVRFDTYRFEVIESDITNKHLHKVAIHFITGWLTLYEIIGDALLLSNNQFADNVASDSADTCMIKLQQGLSIVNYKELQITQYP